MVPRKKRILKIVSVTAGIIVLSLVAALYFQYVALKRIFIDRISHELSAFLGQKVDIGDLYFSPATGINIYDIVVENPEGFKEGRLLKVKKASLQMNYAELVKGIIAFKTIEINGPELTLAKDKAKRLNISDKLRGLLSNKGTTKYRIGELKIRSGLFDMDKDERYHNSDITVTLHHLSSEPGTRTVIVAGAASPGGGKVSLEGWAYLGDDPKKMDLSLSLSNVRVSLFGQIAGKGAAGLERAKVDISLHAEGDTAKGISFKVDTRLKSPGFAFLAEKEEDIRINAEASLNLQDSSLAINKAIMRIDDAASIRLAGIVSDMTRTPLYSLQAGINIPDLSSFNVIQGMKMRGVLTSDKIGLKGSLNGSLPVLSGSIQLRNWSISYGSNHVEGGSAGIEFNGTADAVGSARGKATVRAKSLSVIRTEANRRVIKGAELTSELSFREKDLDLRTAVRAGQVTAKISGRVNNFIGPDRSVRLELVLPETNPADIRSALWDVFPDSLLYAGLSGTLSANVSMVYGKEGLSADGDLRVKGFTLEGENGEYSIGPVNGTVPLHFGRNHGEEKTISLSSFDRDGFQALNEYYAGTRPGKDSTKITVGSLRYGFNLLNKIQLWLERKGRGLNIDRFDANIFGGELVGSAVVDISDGLNYRVGMLARGMSLKRLCEDIKPIKGYITGKVDGVALLKGSGVGMRGLVGRGEFWSYGAGGENTVISREFLRKMGGPSMKNYLGERPFDKGVISLYLQNGFLIFKEMEISHKNFFGMTDLSVKVAPFNNRIAIDHLMSTIAEAAARSKENKR